MGCSGSKCGGSKGNVLDSSKLQVHVGPLEVGTDGMALKPKFNFGIRGGVVKAMVGFRDVRNGAAAEAAAGFVKSYATKGSSLAEILENVKAQEKAPALDDVVEAVPRITGALVEKLDIDVSRSFRVEGVVYLYVGVGVSAGLYLGWLDTSGFRMVGVEGAVATAAGLGITLRAGLDKTRTKARVVCYLSNVGFDVIIHL